MTGEQRKKRVVVFDLFESREDGEIVFDIITPKGKRKAREVRR